MSRPVPLTLRITVHRMRQVNFPRTNICHSTG